MKVLFTFLKKVGLFIACGFVYSTFLFGNQQISSEEADVLSPLFKLLLEHTETGYVLYDTKPICTVPYFQNPFFFGETEPLEQLSVAIQVARNVLEHPLFHSANILFHFDEKERMLLIINQKLFLDTVRDNLSLFQYVLGPFVTPESILETILESDNAFCEQLNYDRVLIGIVLGYGIQNALYESRLENIQYDLLSLKDIPPFFSNASIYQDESTKDELLFLTENERSEWSKGRNALKPTYGFISLEDESKKIEQKIDISSKKLREEKPNFIFGVVNNRNNQSLIQELEAAQEKVRSLMQKPTFLVDALELICHQPITIKASEKHSISALSEDVNLLIAKLLKDELKHHKNQYLPYFIQGFLEQNDHFDTNKFVTASPEAIMNVKLARSNLDKSDAFFENLKKNREFIPILDNFLYYKTLREGSGQTLRDEIKICVECEIFNPSDKILSTTNRKILNLDEVIPGFAHGIKGMKIDEERLIYIHPALAYGVHTFLEKGIYLKAVVRLVEIYDSKGDLPLLVPEDLSFIKSDQFQKKCEEGYKQTLRFIGLKKGQALKSFPGIKFDKITQSFLLLKDENTLSIKESEALNQIFWDYYFQTLQIGSL